MCLFAIFVKEILFLLPLIRLCPTCEWEWERRKVLTCKRIRFITIRYYWLLSILASKKGEIVQVSWIMIKPVMALRSSLKQLILTNAPIPYISVGFFTNRSQWNRWSELSWGKLSKLASAVWTHISRHLSSFRIFFPAFDTKTFIYFAREILFGPVL